MIERMKARMAELDMKTAELARLTELPKSALYRIMDGSTKPENIRIDVFLKICKALNISPEELYYGKKPPTHDKPLSPAEKAFNSLTAEKKEAFMRLMDG